MHAGEFLCLSVGIIGVAFAIHAQKKSELNMPTHEIPVQAPQQPVICLPAAPEPEADHTPEEPVPAHEQEKEETPVEEEEIFLINPETLRKMEGESHVFVATFMGLHDGEEQQADGVIKLNGRGGHLGTTGNGDMFKFRVSTIDGRLVDTVKAKSVLWAYLQPTALVTEIIKKLKKMGVESPYGVQIQVRGELFAREGKYSVRNDRQNRKTVHYDVDLDNVTAYRIVFAGAKDWVEVRNRKRVPTTVYLPTFEEAPTDYIPAPEDLIAERDKALEAQQARVQARMANAAHSQYVGEGTIIDEQVNEPSAL